MVSARNRVVQRAAGIPIQVAGVTVDEGDYLIADRCGTVFIAQGRIDEVLDLAERIAPPGRHGAGRACRPFRGRRDARHGIRRHQGWGSRMSTEDQDLVALFHGLDTPGVSDALDKLGIPGQCLGIAPLDNYRGTVVGPAFTVRYVSCGQPAGTVGDFIDDVAPGDVVVIDNDGRTDCTVWGDIMTQYAGLRGVAGTVIDGVCRDVAKALGDGYPLFTRGRFMRTGKDRVEVAGVNGRCPLAKPGW
jgi:regulator of RNase E activity RraA